MHITCALPLHAEARLPKLIELLLLLRVCRDRERGGRPQLSLAAAIQAAPHLYDRQRLSAVERFITRVDAVPARYTDAKVSWAKQGV